MDYRVAYSPRAVTQLKSLYGYIAKESAPQRAAAFVNSIVDYCDGFATFPHRGSSRESLRPGLRIIGFRRRVTIAFSVDDTAHTVTILGVLYAGRDYETILRTD